MASEEKNTMERKTPIANDEASCVLAEYLELFDCLGYRYKYFMSPNAQLDWFDTYNVRTPLRIHEFLLEKFGGRCRHENFGKALKCGPIESNEMHMKIRHMGSYETDRVIHPRNKVPQLTSLKSRAESDMEYEDVEMETATATLIPAATAAVETATSSNRAAAAEEDDAVEESSDESDDYSIRRCKRMRYSAPAMAPFTYLRRLPTKKPAQPLTADSDDDDNDSSDDDQHDIKSRKQMNAKSEYSQLRYLETEGTITKTKSRQLGGGTSERPVRLRIGYRKHLTNNTTQFALIIYENRDQKMKSLRSRRMLDFSKCVDDDDQHQVDNESLDCNDASVVNNVLPNSSDDDDGGECSAVIATVETPTRSEIATALEEAAFSIQPPVQRTPTKSTPIPPGTPKRRPRMMNHHLNMSGLAPISMTPSAKALNTTTPGSTPKLSAARSLRL